MSAHPISPAGLEPQESRPGIVPPPRSARRPLWLCVVGGGILALAAAGWLWRSPRATVSGPLIRTARAVRGTFRHSIRLAGSISASRFVNIAAPRLQAPDQGRGLTLTFLADNGSRVREGDLLAEFDSQSVMDHIDDVQARVAQTEMDMRKRLAQHDANMQAARQRVLSTRAALEKARLDLRTAPIRSAIVAEELKLSLEEAELTNQEAERQLALTEERQQTEVRLLQLDFDGQIRHLNRHRYDLMHCKVQSPMSGMLVIQTFYRSGEQRQIRVGDELNPGQTFMRVVDQHSLLLDAAMNQADTDLIHLGQRATLHFDAFPDLVLTGQVQSVGAVAITGRRNSYYVRRLPVRVAIDQLEDRVLPDLSASADIVTEEAEGSLLLPREAISQSDGKYVVYVKESEAFAPRQIEIGAASNTQVSVLSGIQEGDEVKLPAPGEALTQNRSAQ